MYLSGSIACGPIRTATEGRSPVSQNVYQMSNNVTLWLWVEAAAASDNATSERHVDNLI